MTHPDPTRPRMEQRDSSACPHLADATAIPRVEPNRPPHHDGDKCGKADATADGIATDTAQFNEFVGQADFPCVGARSALHKNRMRYGSYTRLGDAPGARALRDDLIRFSAEFPDPGTLPVSFVAMFRQEVGDEIEFERLLWDHLQLIHDADRGAHRWDPSVSDDPESDQFSMSVGGRAFFVVGMHAGASRLARRAPMTCLVFNFHDQFESLKASGKYASMQSVIRKRDLALQGSINPVLARFGEASEARQYSGREVPTDWVCPFSRSKEHV